MKPFGLLLAVLFATPALRAEVLVVDAAGGGDFTSLSAAIAAAQSGDTLLVRKGVYVESGPVIIDGKALNVTGEWKVPLAISGVQIEASVIVRNLPPGQVVVLENLLVDGAPGTATGAAMPALTLRDNSGHVRVQSSMFVGGTGFHNDHPDGAVGVDIAGGLSAALVGCTTVGGAGQFSPEAGVKTGDGGPGLVTKDGALLLSETAVWGGQGGGDSLGGWPDGGSGGTGIEHHSGPLFLVSSYATGGDGGTAFSGGDGGHGLATGATGVALLLAGSSASGGVGGLSDAGLPGEDGLDIVDPASLVQDFGGVWHSFNMTSPLREGQAGILVLAAQPTDVTLLFVSAELDQLPLVGYDGVLMLAPGALLGPFPIGPGSSTNETFFAPRLPAGVEALLVHVQPAYVSGGDVSLGTGRVLTVLDAAF